MNGSLCYHCGLPLPPDLPVTGEEEIFCCPGCRQAWQMIREMGLTDYYQRRDADSMGMQPRGTEEAELSPFDDPTYQERLVQTVGESREVSLILDGIHCAACVWLNEQVLRKQAGVEHVWINFATHRARVRWDPRRIPLSAIIGTIRRIGYQAEPYDPTQREAQSARQDRALLTRLGVAAFGAANVMFIAIALYAGYFQGMEAETKQFFHWVSLLLATPVLLFSGSIFVRGAWRGLRMGRLTMDLPIALGAWVTYLYSLVVTLRGSGEIYFDSVSMFLFFLLTGRFLESIARSKAAGAMERLLNLEPQHAVVLRDGEPRSVPVREVRVGETLLIKPGERIPVDGTILTGCTSVDESMLTGESLPVTRAPGDGLVCGTQNLDGAVTLTATRVGTETSLARILRLVERAQGERPPMQGIADRVAARFVGWVLFLAVVTLAIWWWKDPAQALENMVAVLIITCPCALGLAAPAAMITAMGTAARMGILLKNGETIERLERVTRVALDKTGVLTTGTLRVEGLFPLGEMDEKGLLRWAAMLEQHSEHPVGRAIHRACQARGWQPLDALHTVRNWPGLGMEAHTDAGRLRVGRAEFVLEGVATPPPLPPEERETPATWVACGVEGRLLGWIALADTPKANAGQVVVALKKMGLSVALLSGDRRAVVEQVGRLTGVTEMASDLLPEGKEQAIAGWQRGGEVVAMVGDGVNDAPALARADLAMVVAQAADLAVASADVILLNRDFYSVVQVFLLARRTVAIIRQNYLFSMCYNLFAIPLAMAGFVAPIVAAISMPLSSLIVVGNALRLRHPPQADNRSPATRNGGS
ncbi:MAG: heavy metal translocating P-type ATPase [Magnetococcus sp. YQC-3]